MEMITNRNLINANKLTYMVQQYPEKTAAEVLALFGQMPDLEVNAGLWYAQELGWLSKPKEGGFEFLQAPESYMFGDDVDTLEDILTYSFQQLAKSEIDLEEHQFNEWLEKYPAHNVFIVTNKMIADKVIATYTIDDVDADGTNNTYNFYTTFENLEMRWGEKAFKTKPQAPKLKRKKD